MTTRTLPRALAATAAGLALILTGCAAEPANTDGGETATGDAFPVSVAHAFGETEIDAAPERVVTWGWGSTEAAIALGVVPVAMPFQSYGGDEEGVLPWIAEALDEAGAETPTILTVNGEEPPYDEIAAAEPDVILAPYSGITEEQYDTLSEIADVVAYPETAWTTPWRDTITIVGEALGRSQEATDLVEELDGKLASVAEANPDFEGKSVALVWDVAGTFYVYTAEDSRADFVLDLGFDDAPAVSELATGESPFFYTLSYELLDQLESDVLVVFADDKKALDAFLDSAPAKTMPQVKSGAVAGIVGTELIAAVSPPTALSLEYGIDDYAAALSEAVENVEG